MGEEIPESDPTEFGDDCAACFAAGVAPKYMSLYVYDIVDCPPRSGSFLNGFWVLPQDPINPCFWEYVDANVTLRARLDHPVIHQTQVELYTGPPGDHHQAYKYFAAQCDHSIIRANQLNTCPPLFAGRLGFAIWQPY